MEVNEPQENYITGYIKLYRSSVDHWIWSEKPFSKFESWIWLLLHANHSDAKINLGFELIEIKRGQFITSQEKLSSHWGWSRQQVRSFLYLLQKDKMVIIETTTKLTNITICNYNIYQDRQPINNQPITNESTTSQQRVNNESPQLRDYNKLKNDNNKQPIELSNPFSIAFLEEWEKWKQYKKQEHKFNYKSIITEQQSINSLHKIVDGNEEKAISTINHTIANGWKGFVIPSENGQKSYNIRTDTSRMQY